MSKQGKKKRDKIPQLKTSFEDTMKAFAKTDKKEVDKALKADSENKKHEQEEGGEH